MDARARKQETARKKEEEYRSARGFDAKYERKLREIKGYDPNLPRQESGPRPMSLFTYILSVVAEYLGSDEVVEPDWVADESLIQALSRNTPVPQPRVSMDTVLRGDPAMVKKIRDNLANVNQVCG